MRVLLDAFVTVDKNLRFQQRLRSRPFRIILLRAHSNVIDNLVPLVPQVLHALSEMGNGDLRVVGLSCLCGGATGATSSLVLHQNGANQPARRR